MTIASDEELQGWVGRQQIDQVPINLLQAAQMAALLDHPTAPAAGEETPPLWHWVNVFPPRRHSMVGEDGHPVRGGFLPPVALPRRMWAGGKLRFGKPIAVAEDVTRTSTILSVTPKTGASGSLVFVQIKHQFEGASGGHITEEQTVVYRDEPSPDQPAPVYATAPDDYDHREMFRPDPVLLFRYSAVMFNGHRIHYDRDYATKVEGYPDIVMPGPLTATLLAAAVERHAGCKMASFSYRAVKPLFCDRELGLCVKLDLAQDTFDCWAHDDEGHLAMTGRGELANRP